MMSVPTASASFSLASRTPFNAPARFSPVRARWYATVSVRMDNAVRINAQLKNLLRVALVKIQRDGFGINHSAMSPHKSSSLVTSERVRAFAVVHAGGCDCATQAAAGGLRGAGGCGL